MQNPVFPLVKVTLDRERNLLFNNRAKIAFEDATGLSTLTGDIFDSKFSTKTLTALLWAGLRHEDPQLTLDQVGDMLDQNNDRLLEITKAVSEAYAASLPKKKEEQQPADPLKPAPVS